MKKKPKKFVVVIFLLFVVILALFIILRGKKLNTNSTLVNDIYRYISNNDLQICGGLDAYSNETVTYDTLDNTKRLCMAYSFIKKGDTENKVLNKDKKKNTCTIDNKLTFATDEYEKDNCTLTVLDTDKLNEQYKKIYGQEIENYEDFKYDNATICQYHKKENKYYCGLSVTFTYTVGADQHTYRSIKNAKESNNNLVIYDYFIKTVGDTCYTSFNDNVENTNCSSNYKEKVDYKFLKKYGSLYKHTFKKDKNTNNYHWVSSEPVK